MEPDILSGHVHAHLADGFLDGQGVTELDVLQADVGGVLDPAVAGVEVEDFAVVVVVEAGPERVLVVLRPVVAVDRPRHVRALGERDDGLGLDEHVPPADALDHGREVDALPVQAQVERVQVVGVAVAQLDQVAGVAGNAVAGADRVVGFALGDVLDVTAGDVGVAEGLVARIN